MNISAPLESLIPSLDAVVLEVLSATESALSASQIHQLSARGSRQGQAAVLDRLTEHGLVTAEPANRGYLYRLNREHVLAGAVLLATGARRELLDRLTGAIDEMEPRPVHASLFGSVARRTDASDSDIDLLVVVPADTSDELWSERLGELGERVERWTGNRLEWLLFTVDELRSAAVAAEPVIGSLRRDSLRLHGPPLDDLLVGFPVQMEPGIA